MKTQALILAFALVLSGAAALATPAAAASWADPGFIIGVQSQKGRPGQERGQKPRDYRPDRRGGGDERRERMNEDERRALHRDLDKANRELYKQRGR